MRPLALLLSLALGGCAGVPDLLAGPDPATYEPVTARVNDAAIYKADLTACRDALTKTPSGFQPGAVAVAGGQAAVSNAPAAAASMPLYAGEVGAAVGGTLLSQATGARAPRMMAFMSCIREATSQDKSALIADQH